MLDKLPRAPLKVKSVFELLEKNAKTYFTKEAIITYDPDSNTATTISHQELLALVKKTCLFLMSQGIKKGDRFAILMHNCAEIIIFELAGAIIGATTVPLDSKRDLLERKIFKLKDTGSKALFVSIDKEEKDFLQIKKEIVELKIVSWKNFDEFKIIIEKPNDNKIPRSLNSTYIILYTSGTTSHPKGVILSTRACLLNANGIASWQKFSKDDRFNVVLPLHHINSTIFCLSMLLVGGTIILNTRYSASKFWEVVQKFKATNTSIVPTILHDLLVGFKSLKVKINSLKRICIGSAPVLPEETLKFYQTFGIRVVQGYGQTETALRVAGVPVDVLEKEYVEMVKNNTIGTELANNYLGIMDANNNWKKENEEGEICIKGPILAVGYLNDRIATKKSFKGDWFHSGDLGKYKIIKGKKYFYIIGRIKEIIIKGGVNISPSAIEDALLKNFSNIDAVSVVGFSDERMGEEIAAAIVFKKDLSPKSQKKSLNDIWQKAKAEKIEGLSAYETPKKFFVFETLPKTSTGKIMRVEVKKRVAELLTSSEKKNYQVKIIKEDDKINIKKAVDINNSRFQGLSSSVREFTARAKNGFLLGVFGNEELLGSISVLRMDLNKLEKVKTWKEGTASGTLKNNNPKGDCLVCAAISVRSSSSLRGPRTSVGADETIPTRHSGLSRIRFWSRFAPQNDDRKQIATPRSIDMNVARNDILRKYLKSGQDHVISFHQKPKGGIAGAKIWRILEKGRPGDKDALGYNVLMRYPTILSKSKISYSSKGTPAVSLIEA
ncbi:acyl--CoA ligase, partial [Candidatus Gottesmanbacteria bacterium]|nr:acyl--CoA ligase [Candidatus Gottesmanbacteria bacterium]